MRLLIADRIIVGDGERVLNQAAIVLDDNGKIMEIGTETELLERFPQAQVSRYEGCTILPGLIDLHVHVGYPWKKGDYTWKKSDQEKYKNGLNALMASSYLKEALSLGVTTVRDVGAPDGLLRVLKEAIKKGYIDYSPRFFGVNQPIGMTGGMHRHWMGYPGMRMVHGICGLPLENKLKQGRIGLRSRLVTVTLYPSTLKKNLMQLLMKYIG